MKQKIPKKEAICIYCLLYFKNSILNRLDFYFSDYFSNTTKPTARKLFSLILAMLCLDTFRSIRYAHKFVLSHLADASLNSYYYVLKTTSFCHNSWAWVTLSKALQLIPDSLSEQPIFLSIDDTMVEKFGQKFELCSKLYDHAAHNGSNYLNGHCFVSLQLSFPIGNPERIRYLSIPFAYRLWNKEQTKLEMAAQLVEEAMQRMGSEKNVFLLCDSWYPKAPITGLVDQFPNLDLICNVRVDTVLYDLPPAPTGKRGRPRKRGEKINLEDFSLSPMETLGFQAGMRPVLTNLWKDRIVYAIVTNPKEGTGSRRLFLSTKHPDSFSLDFEHCENSKIQQGSKEAKDVLPLIAYQFRWNVESAYYEEKTFWSLGAYRIRSKEGIERLVNLLSIAYGAMTLLPYTEEMFSCYQSVSAQDTRMEIGQQIQAHLFFGGFVKSFETWNKSSLFLKQMENYILSGFRKGSKVVN